MRIVHITDTYPPRTHPIAEQVAGLARAQGAGGHAVHVLAANPLDIAGPGKNRFRASTTDGPGVRVHRMASRLALGLPVLPRGRARIERALGLLRPDVVHLHLPGPSPFGYDAARAARGMDLPLVITVYSSTPETFSKYAVRITGWATAPVATSGVMLPVATRAAEIFGDDAARILPLGANLDPWEAARKRWREHEDLRVLVHAGDKAKRVDTALLAAREQVGDKVTVTAIGSEAKDITDAQTVLAGAPGEVFAALASEHDVYISATTLDRHAAGAARSGLILVGYQETAAEELLGEGAIAGEPGARVGGFVVAASADAQRALVTLAESTHLRKRMRAGGLSQQRGEAAQSPHSWGRVMAAAEELYDLARVRVAGYSFHPD